MYLLRSNGEDLQRSVWSAARTPCGCVRPTCLRSSATRWTGSAGTLVIFAGAGFHVAPVHPLLLARSLHLKYIFAKCRKSNPNPDISRHLDDTPYVSPCGLPVTRANLPCVLTKRLISQVPIKGVPRFASERHRRHPVGRKNASSPPSSSSARRRSLHARARRGHRRCRRQAADIIPLDPSHPPIDPPADHLRRPHVIRTRETSGACHHCQRHVAWGAQMGWQ